MGPRTPLSKCVLPNMKINTEIMQSNGYRNSPEVEHKNCSKLEERMKFSAKMH